MMVTPICAADAVTADAMAAMDHRAAMHLDMPLGGRRRGKGDRSRQHDGHQR